MRLELLGTPLAIVRLDARAPVPEWASAEAPFTSVARTDSELSIVCAQDRVPDDPSNKLLLGFEGGWRALAVEGPLDLSLTGVLASLATPLADAGVAIFAISTYDTDFVLVRERQLEQAVTVLRAAGHEVRAADSTSK